MRVTEFPVEELKKADDILKPDERQSFCVIDQATGRSRPMTLSDLHTSAATIALHDGVPESIRSHFAAATNLLVYSWFYYPFNVTARFLSMVTIEYALRVRFQAGPSTPLKQLVRRAVDERLITDEGFSHLGEIGSDDTHGAEDVSNSDHKRYVDTLIEVLPKLRNDLAHGAHMVHPHSARSVQIAADFINQLFPRPSAEVEVGNIGSQL